MTGEHRLVLTVAILASFVAFLDGSVVNVALPAIQRDLGGGLIAQQWIVDAYLISLGALILIAGSLSDLFGRKRILKVGLAGFLVTSLLCAIAPNPGVLIAARLFQGVAGALLVPSSLALIISTFSGKSQGKAIGTWTAWTGIAFIVGPLLGGILVDYSSWRLVFAINVIPILITLWLLARVTNKDDIKRGVSIDYIGAVLCALGLGGLVYGLIEIPHYGWRNPQMFVPILGGVILLAAFLIYEYKQPNPMLPLSLFKRRNFSVGNVATVAIYAGLTAATFLLILFVQQVGGYSALRAGLSLLPITILMFLLSPRFGALSGRYGPRLFMGVGPLIAGIGFLLMLRLGASVQYWMQLLPALLVFGFGLSMTVAPLTAAILGDVDSRYSGMASAINNALARIAGLLAVAAIGAIVGTRFSATLTQKVQAQQPNAEVQQALAQAKTRPLIITPPHAVANNTAFTAALNQASVAAFHDGIWTMAVLVMAGGVVALIGIRNPEADEPTLAVSS